MIRSTLPKNPEREDLLGFWVGVSLLGAALLGLLPVLLGAVDGWVGLGVGATVLVVSLALGHRRERAVDRAYEAWDRAARAYTRRARGVVIAIWYWSVIALVSRAGNQGLVLDASPWSRRETVPPEGYEDQGDGLANVAPEGTPRGVVRWARDSGRGWTMVLTPLLAILRALDLEGRRTVASDNYTLY